MIESNDILFDAGSGDYERAGVNRLSSLTVLMLLAGCPEGLSLCLGEPISE
jgi:hypothetical protein